MSPAARPLSSTPIPPRAPLPPGVPGAAGVLVFVHNSQLSRVHHLLDKMNRKGGRVSKEVLTLYTVTPTREHVRALCAELQDDPTLAHVAEIDKLRPNNALRDLTAPWRMLPEFTNAYSLLVGLEDTTEELLRKYPHPNLTLQAGKIEPDETPLQCAVRELFEEARVKPSHVYGPPVGLMSKGMLMYSVYVHESTELNLVDDILYINEPICA